MDQTPLQTDDPASFLTEEEGAVTVDWVVLTAAVVGLVFLIVTVLNNSLVEETAQDGIAQTLIDSEQALQSALAQD